MLQNQKASLRNIRQCPLIFYIINIELIVMFMSEDELKYNVDYIHVVSRAIDKVCENRSKIVFQSDEYSPRKVAEYVASIKALISILPKKYLPKNYSKRMVKIDSLYKSYHYQQVVRKLDKVMKEIFGKLNRDDFIER